MRRAVLTALAVLAFVAFTFSGCKKQTPATPPKAPAPTAPEKKPAAPAPPPSTEKPAAPAPNTPAPATEKAP